MSSDHRDHARGLWDPCQDWDGVWFLPDGDLRMGGRFQLADFRLRVLGGQLVDMEHVPLIYGVSSGVPLTLVSCGHLSVDDVGMEVHSQTIHVDYAIVGAHLRPGNFRFGAAEFRHPALDSWAGRYPFEPLDVALGNGFRRVQHDPATAMLDGATVELVQQGSSSSGRTYQMRASIHEHLRVDLGAPISLGALLDTWVRPIVLLLNLCVGVPADYTRLRIRTEQGVWLDAHFPTSLTPSATEFHRHRMPLPFAAMDFEVILRRWFTTYELVGAVCDTVLSPTTFQLAPYARFMALGAASEALAGKLYPPSEQDKQQLLDRAVGIASQLPPDDAAWLRGQIRYSGRSFRRSLETLRDELGRPHHWYLEHHFGRDWPRRFTDARNGYAHGLGMAGDLGEVFLPITSDALALLLRSHLLKSLGLSDDELAAALHRDGDYRDMQYRTIEEIPEP